MNEDAFARRFYADRAELDSLGIQLTVDRPADGVAEQENYSLRPENFHLPPIAFTDEELASLQFALTLLDGEFAYAEPLRLALQQISWGRPSPLRAPDQRSRRARHHGSRGRPRAVAAPGQGRDGDLPPTRRSPSTTTRWSATSVGARKVDPYHLLFQGGQFYLLGHSHERDALRVFRLSRIRGKVAYATKAEHDFKRPSDFDPRAYANRAEWQFGDAVGDGRGLDLRAHRLAGRAPLRPLRRVRRRPTTAAMRLRDRLRRTRASSSSWVLGLGEHARVAGPAGAGRRRRRARRAARRAPRAEPQLARRRWRAAAPSEADAAAAADGNGAPRGRDPPRALRAPRHARLDPHRGRPRGRAAARRGASASGCRSPTRSCARTSTSSTS